MTVIQAQGRMRLPALRNMIIAGLVGNVVVNIILQALIVQELIPPLAIIMALTLVVAGVCATRWRWAPHLAVIWCVLSVVPGLEPYFLNLTHPAETGTFIATLLGLALLLVTVVAGVTAMIYGDRQVAEGRAPRWLRSFLIGMAMFVLGASLVAAIPLTDTTAGVSPEVLAALPALKAKDYLFEQPELRAKVGETVVLRLDNADSSTHFLDIDEFNVHTPIPAGKSSVAIFKPTQPGTFTFYCHPHANKAAGTGMVGRLIVEP
ncbi:MAG TPA: cupredoxin domain-containing protein [Herpetosiphonaceae bacterium]|nr:cupredoxin domain-containing protein [Herpetosiphonaceae bacterium]